MQSHIFYIQLGRWRSFRLWPELGRSFDHRCQWRAAQCEHEGKERFLLAGIVADLDDMLAGGEKMMLNGEEVGVVNSPAHSHRMKKFLALVHVKPEAAVAGTMLEVVGDGMSCAATVAQIQFYDPKKT